MKCPFCGHLKGHHTIDKRPWRSDTAYRRRRKCPACSKIFTTLEMVLTSDDPGQVEFKQEYEGTPEQRFQQSPAKTVVVHARNEGKTLAMEKAIKEAEAAGKTVVRVAPAPLSKIQKFGRCSAHGIPGCPRCLGIH